MSIPKIIHQIWIGPNPKPINMMNSWKNKHPDFEYILWDDKEIKKRNMTFICQQRIYEMEEWCGKADIMRMEILFKYGGIYLDADSFCIEHISYLIDNYKAFAGYENEQVRPGLVANGNLGFPPNHPLCKNAISWILQNPISNIQTGRRAWMNTGPLLLTNLLKAFNFPDVSILPSYTFLPEHPSGPPYTGHGKVYAYQEWGSTKQNYHMMNSMTLPTEFTEPKEWVSVLISSYNTNHKYVVECLDSILNQKGYFGMEIVWINDGSNELSTKLLERTLKEYEKKMRFTKFVYKKWDKNMGLTYSLHKGVLLCSHELIIRFDSDDIMLPERIIKQINYMKSDSDCVICGTNIQFFKVINKEKMITGATNHKELLTWNEYKNTRSHWIANHPTLCFKKSAVLSVGNYNINNQLPCEDFELELKLLKKYGKIYNIQEVLLHYRLHEEQVTASPKFRNPEVLQFRNNFIEEMTKD
jgi:hypothetical protein